MKKYNFVSVLFELFFMKYIILKFIKYFRAFWVFGVCFSFVFFLTNNTITAQTPDTILINQLIKEIAKEQVKTKTELFEGMFPSFRECSGIPHNYQPDNTVFFTAISIFTLQNLLPYLKNENKIIAENVIENGIKSFIYYKNKKGPFYGFWPTDSIIMPHTYYLKYLKCIFGQGDDADDAVMILMASKSNDSICSVLKKRLIEVSNLNSKRIFSTFKRYKNIQAYSTYLGYKMPVDFDLGVQCNILYFMFDRKLPLVKQDSATIKLLQQIIANRDYMKHPIYLSPYYVTSPILLYHISRLIGKFKINELEPYRQQLIDDIRKLYNSGNTMDNIILNTSLIRLKAKPFSSEINSLSEFKKSDQNKFIFFQARAAFWYPTPLKQIFLHFRYINYYFYCPTYNKLLWLEYLVEKNSISWW